MKIIRVIDKLIERCESWIIILFVGFMIVISFAQVILRNFFLTGISGADHMLRHMVFWTALLGASILTREARHIKIDILTSLFQGKTKIINAILVNAISCIVCVILFIGGIKFVCIEKEYNEISQIALPVWTLQIIMPIALGMITLRFFFKVLEKVAELIKK